MRSPNACAWSRCAHRIDTRPLRPRRRAGIADEHLGPLFTRFWRGPARRDTGAGPGRAGPGLSMCQEIATAHGCSLVARNGERGAEFALSGWVRPADPSTPEDGVPA